MVFRRATSAVFAVCSFAMLTPAVAAAISEFCLPGYISRDGKALEAGLLTTVYTGCVDDTSCFGDDPASFFQDATIVPPDQSPANLFDAVVTKIDWAEYDAPKFAMTYAGYFRPTKTGTWTFHTKNDDDSYLFIGKADQTLDSLKDGAAASSLVFERSDLTIDFDIHDCNEGSSAGLRLGDCKEATWTKNEELSPGSWISQVCTESEPDESSDRDRSDTMKVYIDGVLATTNENK